MADKVFATEDTLASHGVTLNVPPFMKDGKLTAHYVKLIPLTDITKLHHPIPLTHTEGKKIVCNARNAEKN